MRRSGRADMAEALLEAEGLVAGYGPAQVLFGIDLTLARGEDVDIARSKARAAAAAITIELK